jgi:hypothetical protein
VPNSPHHRTTAATVEPSRLPLILERLHSRFYEDQPAADWIAAAVLAELKVFSESPRVLPH